jgi:ABC-type multidrug transport system ATPase subunit
VAQVPMMFLVAICGLVPLYAVAAWPWESLPTVWLVFGTFLVAFEMAAQLFSLDGKVLFGLLNFQNIWVTSFIFSGIFVTREDVIWPLRVFTYILPFGWGTRSFFWALFHDWGVDGSDGFSGTAPCDPGLPGCFSDAVRGSPGTGFFCPGLPAVECWGDVGPRILDSIGSVYRILTSENTLAADLGYLVAIAAAFKALYLLRLASLLRLRAVPRRPPAALPPLDGPQRQTLLTVNDVVAPPSPLLAAAGRGLRFAFSDCSFAIQVRPAGGGSCARKSETRYLLRDVSASVSSGEVLAVMGPSGAGKTTLLRMLALEKGPGARTGHVAFNGKPFTPLLYTRYATFMEQGDSLWAFLTAREQLEYAVRLSRPALRSAERAAAVDELLGALGLESCQHTRAGNALVRGLSGGQRRRLSLALALAKEPLLVFLDEPTSGLDAAGAAAVMALLKSVARRVNAAILCTIHQPSSAVFAGFDKTLILSGGRAAYCGPASELVGYLASIGQPVPANTNPADHMLAIANADFTDASLVEETIAQWSSKQPPPQTEEADCGSEQQPAGAGVATQFAVLLHKHGRLLLRDPIMYIARCVIFVVISLSLSIIYIDTRRRDSQEQLFPRLFLEAPTMGAFPAAGAVNSVSSHPISM